MVEERKVREELVDEGMLDLLPGWVSVLNRLWRLAKG